MAIFDYNEAVFGALAYIYGDDDSTISVKEKEGFESRFEERHYLSRETMKAIYARWKQGSEDFYQEVIDSLNEYSLTERLEAYRTICIILNDFSSNRNDRWEPARRIREGMGISSEEYDRYSDN